MILGTLLLILLLIYIFYCYFSIDVELKNIKYNKISSDKKIALCFMIYDKINNEDLWYEFIKNVDKSKYNIYIHYKYDKKLKYFDKYKISDPIETNWGCISLVYAQNLLLKYALKDSNNKHIIFLSQSCIPLKPFDYIYAKLDTNKSYFNLMKNNVINHTSNNLIKYFKKEHIQKSSQWSILNRKHAKLLIDNEKHIKDWFYIIIENNKKYKNILYALDEIVYICILNKLNMQKELKLTNNIGIGATTISYWMDTNNVKTYNKSRYLKYRPFEYSHICIEELKAYVESDSLFARKFIDKCKGIELLKNIIN